MSWVVASETIRPSPKLKTPTRSCFQGLCTLVSLFGMYGEGSFAKVSLNDYPYLKRLRWWVNNSGYAACKRTWKSKTRVFLMHKVVMTRMGLIDEPFTKGVVGDHRNRDTLDNARLNLRLATRHQNSLNHNRLSGATNFMGVYRSKNGFRCHISVDKYERESVGSYETAEKAARVRDALARFYHGEFAITNFVGNEAYDLKTARRQVRESRNHVSSYLGVTRTPKSNKSNPWLARFVDLDHVRHYLGIFQTEQAAARAVDDARVAAGLPRVNFPDEVPS